MDVYWYYLGAIGLAFILGTIIFTIAFQGAGIYDK